MEGVVIFIGLLLAISVTTLVLGQFLPKISEAIERVRVERAAAEASWRIHVQASKAFEDLLSANRDHDHPDDQSGGGGIER